MNAYAEANTEVIERIFAAAHEAAEYAG